MLRRRLPACGIVDLSHNLVSSLLVYDVERCVEVMHYEIEPHLVCHLEAKLEWFHYHCCRLYQHLAMPPRVLRTTRSHHLREPAVRQVFVQRTLLREHPAAYRYARIRLQHTDDLAPKLYITCLLHVNVSKRIESFLELLLGEIDPGLPS